MKSQRNPLTFILIIQVLCVSVGCVASSIRSVTLVGMTTSEWLDFRDHDLRQMAEDLRRSLGDSDRHSVCVLPCKGENSFTFTDEAIALLGATREDAVQSLTHTADTMFRAQWRNFLIRHLSGVDLVTRSPDEMRALMDEIDLGATGAVEASSVRKLGSLIGAHYITIPSVDMTQLVQVQSGHMHQLVYAVYKVTVIETSSGKLIFERMCSDLSHRKARLAQEYVGQKWDWPQ